MSVFSVQNKTKHNHTTQTTKQPNNQNTSQQAKWTSNQNVNLFKSYLALDAICLLVGFLFFQSKSIQLRPCASYTLSLLSESSRTKNKTTTTRREFYENFCPNHLSSLSSFRFSFKIPFSRCWLRVHIVTCSNWFKLLLFTFARFSLTIFTATNPWDGGTHHAKTYKNSNKILGNGRYQPKIMAKITVSHKRFSLNFFCMWKLILWIL